MMVRFATICDHDGCTARSEEYTAYPSCRECYRDFCPAHQEPGTLREDEGVNDCLCPECAKENE